MNRESAALWEALHDLFDDDDRELPEVQIKGIAADEAQAIMDALLRLAHPLRPDQTVWDQEREADVPIADVPDAGRLAAVGRLPSLHLVLTGVRFGGSDLPDLGVSIWPGTFAIDYRAGPDWSREVLSRFIDLLCALQALSQRGHLVLADEASHGLPQHQQNRFRAAVQRYLGGAAL